jgi:poly(hydroxyalkanoate) depolymerase family esterase
LKIHDDLPARLLNVTPLSETSHAGRQFDVHSITDTIQRALASAGLNTQSGPMKGVTDTIQQALSAAGLTQCSAPPSQQGVTIDGVARKRGTPHDSTNRASIASTALGARARSGEFVSRSFTNSAGTRAYKLYIPASYAGELGKTVSMVVMLHGCTQTPDDFAAGTRMNALAERHGFLVVYPAQATNANGSKCWNWFRAQDQSRDGEPSLIAGITREVASNYRVDERRIFAAGMSAGAAMAVILGATYPELFAAVGAHSGLAFGAAHDMPSAFGVMKGTGPLPGMPNPPGGQMARRPHAAYAVPTIVFHGDCDQIVDARNGAAIVADATANRSDEPRLRVSVHEGTGSGGRTYSRTVYTDDANQPVVEQWVLHGAGHTWSGGSPSGSFTDARGPDASVEMIRFFHSLQRAGVA